MSKLAEFSSPSLFGSQRDNAFTPQSILALTFRVALHRKIESESNFSLGLTNHDVIIFANRVF